MPHAVRRSLWSPPPRRNASPWLVLGALVMALAGVWLHPAQAGDGHGGANLDIDTVPAIDLGRYAGLWYELAHGEAAARGPCVADIVTEHRPVPGQRLKLVQSCRRSDGRSTALQGVARPVDGGSGARFEVSWLPAGLRWLPAGRQDHWVVALDPHYRVAVVSDRQGRLQRVLAREPQVTPVAWQALMTHLDRRGFETSHLVPTLQLTRTEPGPVRPAAVWASSSFPHESKDFSHA